MRFLNALDKRKYRNFLAHVENEAISGAAAYPETLDASFSRAVNFRLAPSDHSRVNKFESSSSPSIAMVADALPKSRTPRQKKVTSDKSPRPPSPPTSKSSPTGAGGKAGYKYKPCKLCGEATHFMEKCPMADEMVAKFKRTQLQSIHFAREGGDDNDDEADHFALAVTLTIDINGGPDDMVFLDTGASKGIFGNVSLLTDVASAPPVIFHGISGSALPVTANQAGRFEDFGKIMVDGNARANVISMSEQKSRGFSFRYENDEDTFYGTSHTGGVHQFIPYKGMYALVRNSPRIRPTSHSSLITVPKGELNSPPASLSRSTLPRSSKTCLAAHPSRVP